MPAPAGLANDDLPAVPAQTLGALFVRFLRFGALAWGGPVAQIAMIQRELVDEERWITRERFRRALAVYQVLPGPEAHELCVYFGMLARGRIGAVLAGLGFMLPGFVLMLLLAILYTNGALQGPGLQPLLAGMRAAVIGVIVRALLRIGGHALHDRWLAAAAAVACVASLAGIPFPAVLVACGLGYVSSRGRSWPVAAVIAAAVLCWSAVAWSAATADAPRVVAQGALAAPTLLDLFTAGLRAGLLTFGGAYTVIAFLQADAVVHGGWLTHAQFLDGLGLAGVLPAPLVIFGTFVGHVAGGVLGAIAMTVGIFAPAFAFTLLGHAFFERITDSTRVQRFLDGVTAGVVGLMTATTLELARNAIVDWSDAAIAIGALVLLFGWRSRAAVPTAVAIGALAGMLFERS